MSTVAPAGAKAPANAAKESKGFLGTGIATSLFFVGSAIIVPTVLVTVQYYLDRHCSESQFASGSSNALS